MISKHANEHVRSSRRRLKNQKLGSRRCHLRARALETLRGRFGLDLAVIHLEQSYIDLLFRFCGVRAQAILPSK